MFRKGPCKLTLLLCALVHASKTWAGDSAALADSSLPDKVPAPALPAAASLAGTNPFALNPSIDVMMPPAQFAAPTAEPFHSGEFTPRKHSSEKPGVADYGSGDPMFRSTTVWQRLNEFRAQDHRVRVLTLWEMGGTNLSIQAGRKGDPSLQWSSSWTNRSKVSRGLLDHFLAASMASMANKSHSSFHFPSNAATPTAPLITTAVPASK
jgi:hypothetical protein